MGQGKKDEAEAVKAQVNANAARLAELEEQEKELQEKVTRIMMTIPNIIDRPYRRKDDSCNVEIEKFGDPVVPDSKSHITQTSWSVSMVLILMRQESCRKRFLLSDG